MIKERNKYKKNFHTPAVNIIQEYGKMPPQATELEELVLGAMMLEKDVVLQIIDILKPQAFYKDAHVRIYQAILNLSKESKPVDIMTVMQELKRTGELEIVGGAYYITQLTNRVAGTANTEFHARIILQKFMQRELIRTLSQTIIDAYDESSDVFELLDNVEKNIFQIYGDNIKKDAEHVKVSAKQVMLNLEAKQMQEDGLTGVPSGLRELDKITNGWRKTDLIIIAARPAMGKSSLMRTLASNAAVKFKRPVALFSLEMSTIQITEGLVYAEANIDSYEIKKVSKHYQLEKSLLMSLDSAIATISQSPIYIDDTPGLSVFQLRAKARRLVEKQKVELIIIDYLQLMTGGGDVKGNREQEISFISRSLKGLAKELNIPIIALSQLSRAVESRGGDKRPQLSDLRESGAIEQDADMVMFIHRPEYYGIMEIDGASTIGVAELIIAKHRNGPIKTAAVKYQASLTKFSDIDSIEHSFNPVKGITPNNNWEIETHID